MLLEAPQEDKSSNYKKDGSSLELPFKRKNSYLRSRGLTACNIAMIITITISVIHCSSIFLLLTQPTASEVSYMVGKIRQTETEGMQYRNIRCILTYILLQSRCKRRKFIQSQNIKVYFNYMLTKLPWRLSNISALSHISFVAETQQTEGLFF